MNDTPYEVKASTNWQIISLGKILFRGEKIVVDELNDELKAAEKQGVCRISKVKPEPKVKPAEAAAPVEEAEKEEAEIPEGYCPVCKEGPFARLRSHVVQKEDKEHTAYLDELEKEGG